MSNRSNPKPGEIWRHFKGFKAEILAVATHSETMEELVVYTCSGPCDPNKRATKNPTHARPLSMFMSEIDRPPYSQKYRFEFES